MLAENLDFTSEINGNKVGSLNGLEISRTQVLREPLRI